ncbi:hypothetical protein M2119_000353 [Aurantimicrobium minutum]|uniref:hypothetical protein n=1 Tax=Aurantimicrobium minutum TaxID=708131 RepID=UPI0024759943|nr:hypothetical protein [Aurantimicrobium minutum]MDH6532116.1 hypothetical protein [Aurantimicrobium minutum]
MSDVEKYNAAASAENSAVIGFLFKEFQQALPTATFKVWHGAPVWFLEDIPVVGYQDHTHGTKVLFWSGKDFSEPGLLGLGKHRAAGITYTDVASINVEDLRRYLRLSTEIIWDYRSLRPTK